MKRMVWLSAAMAVAPGLFAQSGTSYECTNGGEVRRVEVAYPAGGEVPCEVRYHRSGPPEVLWSAASEVGYCTARAEEFVERLRSLGWTCSNRGAAAPARDDTSVLGAGPSVDRR